MVHYDARSSGNARNSEFKTMSLLASGSLNHFSTAPLVLLVSSAIFIRVIVQATPVEDGGASMHGFVAAGTVSLYFASVSNMSGSGV